MPIYFCRLFLLFSTLLLSLPLKADNELIFSTLFRGSDHQDQISEQRLRNAYKQLGYNIRIVAYPGRRALLEANLGNVDGEFRRSKLDAKKYPNLIRVQAPVNHLELCAFGLTEQADFDGKNSLKNYKVGVIRGGRRSERLAALSAYSVRVSNTEQLTMMLKSHRIQLGIGNCKSIADYKAQHKEDFHIYAPPLERIPLYHYLHRRHQDLVGPLTNILRRNQE